MIFLDMDGVISNWLDAAISACVPNYTEFIDETRERVKNNGGRLDGIISKKSIWASIDQLGSKWWANLELFPWSKDLWKLCNEISGGNTYFLTAPARHPNCVKGKLFFIQEHFKTNKFIFTSHKFLLAQPNRLLIDDTLDKCIKFGEYGGQYILWPHQYSNFDINDMLNRIKKEYYRVPTN